MTVQTSTPRLRERSVGEIAATLPGATAVFRRFRIDFCCNGDLTLDGAARRRGADPDELERALGALGAGAAAAPAVMESGALIEHIQAHFHEAHRRDLPELVELARKVEAVHREDPKVPAGLSDLLQRMLDVLEAHMADEEDTLFPMMRQQSSEELATSISALRHEHDDHGSLLHRMEILTDEFSPPEGACRSWQALYVGAARFAEDLMEHIHLENNVLFPRFATPAEGQA